MLLRKVNPGTLIDNDNSKNLIFAKCTILLLVVLLHCSQIKKTRFGVKTTFNAAVNPHYILSAEDVKAKYMKLYHYNNFYRSANTTCQKDTLMIQHHIDVSKLSCCNSGSALIQTGHSNIWVSISANHTVLKVQLILITRH